MSLLMHVKNPVAPAIGTERFEVAAGTTVSHALTLSGWRLPPSTKLLRHGRLMEISEDDDSPIIEGEIISYVTYPQGGGNGGSQILQVVATIALMVLSYVLFGPAGLLTSSLALSGTVVAGITWAMVAQATFFIAGSALLSILLPKPSQPAGIGSPSPTYSLSAQSNRARIGEAIPEWFGRFNIYPDLAAAPYLEFNDDDEEVLFELFCCGMGDYEFDQVRVADTVIWEDGSPTGNYPDIEIEIVPPGSSVTLFPDNVVTSLEVDSIHLLHTDEDGYDWSGPFICSGPGTVAESLGFDIALPGGLYRVGDSGDVDPTSVSFQFQAMQIDDAGNPIGDWITVLDETLELQQISPVRRSYQATLDTPGRYKVRGECTSAKLDQSDHHNTLYWFSMRAYLPNIATFDGVTILAVKAKATTGLNGSTAQKLNTVQTRKLPLYDLETGTWSDPVATRSIAAAASYVLRADNAMRLPDSRIDLATLWTLEATRWTSRGDTFDGGFDSQRGAWDALQAILRCGRTRPLMAGSKIAFVRDEPRAAPETAFLPSNITPGSFDREFRFHDDNAVTAVLAVFIDEDTWKQNTVLCALPDSELTEDTAPQLTIFGMVNRDQVFRETITMVAASFYRRQFVGVQTEQDGRVVMFGSPVKVGHYAAGWGTSASVIGLQEGPLADGVGQDILTLSEPWDPATEEDPTLFMSILTPDGRVYGEVKIALLDRGADDNHARVQLLQSMDPGGKYAGLQPRDWPVWEDEGLQMERPRAALTTATIKLRDALVISMAPAKGQTTQLLTVIDDPRVHTAEESGGGGGGDLVITSVDIAFDHQEVTEFGTFDIVNVTASGATDAVSFQKDHWDSFHDEWANSPQDVDRTWQIGVLLGQTLKTRMRAIGSTGPAGDWVEADPYTAT